MITTIGLILAWLLLLLSIGMVLVAPFLMHNHPTSLGKEGKTRGLPASQAGSPLHPSRGGPLHPLFLSSPVFLH